MPKRTLKQLAPSPAALREIKLLRFMGEWIFEPNLWHVNRYSASMAFFVGLFVAFMPIPGQMIIAALLAVVLRCNLPLSVGLSWITNPVTIPAMFYLAYSVGALIIDVPVQALEFELNWAWLRDSLGAIWKPLILGSVICGLFFGSMGFFIISMMWRWRVVTLWRQRKEKRLKRRNHS
ncbi:MAG: hypothetical protein ACJASY_000435 [Halioglobus sp.]|jgi:uncharacterized protein (DUF2062 family)